VKVFGLKIDGYLVLILLVAALATVLPARDDAAVWLGLVTKVAIGAVFFLHGARLSREAVIGGLMHWRLHLVVLGATFAAFPLLALSLASLPAAITPPELAAGLIFLGCLPSTIQSSIAFIGIARGNVAAGVAAASASNLLGVFATPLLAGLLLHAQGGVSAAGVLAIVLQILAPFVAGQALRPWIGDFVARRNAILSRFDRGTILLVVFVAFSGAVVEGVWTRLGPLDLVRLLLLCAVLLAAMLRRPGAPLLDARPDRHHLLRLEKVVGQRRAHGGRVVPRRGRRRGADPASGLPSDATDGLRLHRPTLRRTP
jgi:sodium/bile acid cotransporter 7